MANFGYHAKSIISGVSTRPYALREDGHMLEASENCMLSPKFGLCKRPGSTFLQTVEASNATNFGVFIPLLVDDSERVVVGLGATNWQVFSKTGAKYHVCHYPSSQSSTVTAAGKYALHGASFDPKYTSTTTIGDVTFIADSQVEPKMLDAVTAASNEDGRVEKWLGYNIPAGTGGYVDSGVEQGIEDPSGTGTDKLTVDITNDDAFVYWVKDVVYSSAGSRGHMLNWEENNGGTITSYQVLVSTRKDDSQLHQLNNANGKGWPSPMYVAACMAYKLSSAKNGSSDCMIQATTLDTQSFGAPTGSIQRNGLKCLMGMYVNKDIGTLSSISQVDYAGAAHKVLAHKSVDTIADLPPNSFVDHTLKVGVSDLLGGFHMRFVSDDPVIKSYSNNFTDDGGYASGGQVDPTTKIPKNGHWEEYCGVDVTQNINGTTMPLMLVRRPDDSFGLMEARGAFRVNSDSTSVVMLNSGDTVQMTLDAGFSDNGDDATMAPIVIGDTIEFTETSDTLATGLAHNTKYYIKTKVRVSARVWKFTLGLTNVAADATVPIGSDVTGAVTVKLTTYEDFDWTKRVAGDDTTNPLPGFIGNKITSLFNFQDRLGLVSEGSVVFSGTGDYFNFFKTTVRDLDAADPFTASPNLADGDQLKFAVPFESDLVLLSNEAQYTLKATEGLSPTTVAIVKSSSVSSDTYAMPVAVSDNLYLSYSQEDTSGVTVLKKSRQAADRYNVLDTSADTPGYLPRSPRRMTGSSKHNMLFYLDDEDSTELYAYSWLDSKDGRVQSAWMKWTFGTDYDIRDIMVFGDRLYLLTDTTNMLCLEYIDLDLTSKDNMLDATLKANFNNILIDHKAAGYVNATQTVTGTGDADAGIGGVFAQTNGSSTTIDLKYRLTGNNDDNIVIVLANGTGTVYEFAASGTTTGTVTVSVAGGSSLAAHGADEGTPAAQATTRLTLHGVNLSGVDYYVGLKYDMLAVYGPFIPSAKDAPLSGRKIFAKTGRLTYSMANEFNLKVTQDQEYTQTITAANATSTKEGDVLFSIRKHLPDLQFKVQNSKPWNAMFQILKYDFAVQEIAGG